jgi:putative flippase GtrA
MEEENDSRKTRRNPAGIRNVRWIAKLTRHIPPDQFGRYLAIGIGNTVFGYSTYALFTALLTPYFPYPYILASLLSSLLNVTFAFLNYKWFIFKTKGNYLREWSRCIVVYGGTMAAGTAFLPVTVFLLRHMTSADRSAPYIAGALNMSATVVAGFLGHKHFSFAPSAKR